MTTVTEPQTRCSFCGKLHHEIARMVAGPGIYICNECVGLCNTLLETPAADLPADPELMHWQGMSDQQLLDHLPTIAAVASQVESSLTTWVRRVRTRGIAWAKIGAALGMSRQSAWERFSGED